VRKMFHRLWYSPKMNLTEKLEFLYLSPYYLQSLFFLVGTLAWLLAEIIFRAKLPFWTATWGWALVFTNMLSLVVMNAAGMFIEESDRGDYKGLLSFTATTYIVVPFQAYAAIKGLFEKEEGHWFRTPKTGLITIEVMRGHFARLFGWLFPRKAGERTRRRHLNPKPYTLNPKSNPQLALATAGNLFTNFLIPRRQAKYIGRGFLSLLLIFSVLLTSFAPYAPYFVKPKEAQASSFGLLEGAQEESDQSDELAKLTAAQKEALQKIVKSKRKTLPRNRRKRRVRKPKKMCKTKLSNLLTAKKANKISLALTWKPSGQRLAKHSPPSGDGFGGLTTS